MTAAMLALAASVTVVARLLLSAGRRSARPEAGTFADLAIDLSALEAPAAPRARQPQPVAWADLPLAA